MYNDKKPFDPDRMTFKNLEGPVKAFWEPGEQEYPEFLTRTNTSYFRAPSLELLEARGITNRLLESLIQGLPDGVIIAGGFMTAVVGETTDAQDIDLFFTSSEAFAETTKRLLNPDRHQDEAWAIWDYKPDPATIEILDQKDLKGVRFLKFIHASRPPIQLIKLAWYESAEHVIDSFDLTIAQFALDVKTGDLVANPVSFLDLARKRIVLHRMQFPSSSLRRIIKYSKKGYYACPGSLATISENIAKHISNDDKKYVYID